jgi:RNA polymerase nonessential primary-like sigma factor
LVNALVFNSKAVVERRGFRPKIFDESLQRDIRELLADLTTRERQVIELRYGFLDGKSHSLADIGRTLELSRERVRQIELKALQKLRQSQRHDQIRDYFEALS